MSDFAALLQIFALPGTLGFIYGLGRLVRDVWVAKINANRDIEVAKFRDGHRRNRGVHRADE